MLLFRVLIALYALPWTLVIGSYHFICMSCWLHINTFRVRTLILVILILLKFSMLLNIENRWVFEQKFWIILLLFNLVCTLEQADFYLQYWLPLESIKLSLVYQNKRNYYRWHYRRSLQWSVSASIGFITIEAAQFCWYI